MDRFECKLGLLDGGDVYRTNLDKPSTFRVGSPVLHLHSGGTWRHSGEVEATIGLKQAETSGGMGGYVEFAKVQQLFESIKVWVR